LRSRAQHRKLPSAAPFIDTTRKLDQREQRWICEPRQNFEDRDWKRRSHKSQLVRLGRSASPVSIKCSGSRQAHGCEQSAPDLTVRWQSVCALIFTDRPRRSIATHPIDHKNRNWFSPTFPSINKNRLGLVLFHCFWRKGPQRGCDRNTSGNPSTQPVIIAMQLQRSCRRCKEWRSGNPSADNLPADAAEPSFYFV
jgi:hypothetical protein